MCGSDQGWSWTARQWGAWLVIPWNPDIVPKVVASPWRDLWEEIGCRYGQVYFGGQCWRWIRGVFWGERLPRNCRGLNREKHLITSPVGWKQNPVQTQLESTWLCIAPGISCAQNAMTVGAKVQNKCVGFMDEDSSPTFVTKICTEWTKVFSFLETYLQLLWDKRYQARTPEGK